MLGWLRHWKWVGSVMVFIALLLAYPVLMFLHHDIPPRITGNPNSTVWADARVGAAIDLIQAEVDDRGWTSGLPDWHPQTQLIALPAFQKGLSDTLANFVQLRARPVSEGQETNADLTLAATLIRQANGEESPDQLAAAMQALRRFDGLIARAVLDDRTLVDLMRAETMLYERILSDSLADIQRVIQSDNHKFFDGDRTTRYYRTLGRIYVIGTLLKAGAPDDIVQPGYRDALEKAQTSLDLAFRSRPLIVSNPEPGTFSLGGNDLVALAYLIEDSIKALSELEQVLRENQLASATDLGRRS